MNGQAVLEDSPTAATATARSPLAAQGVAAGPLTGWRLRAALLALAALAGAVYANSLANGYAFDDMHIIQQNPRVHDLTNWREIWLTPYWPFFGRELGLYRPLTIFLYAAQWAAGGGAPVVFHAVNVALHVLATLLVFSLLRRLTAGVPALLGALVFAVHPVHTEAIANTVGQAELLTAAALLGACLVHAARPPGPALSWPRRLAVLLLFATGILAKESAVILPALLVAVDFAQARIELSARGLRRYAGAMALPFFLLLAAFALYLVFRLDALEGALVGVDPGPQLYYLKEHRILNALRAFPEFVRLLFFPQHLSSDYFPAVILPTESFTPMAGVGLGLLLGIAGLALLTPWFPAIGFPAAWFLIGISTVSNLLFDTGILVAERTLYLPSFAVSALVAFAWWRLAPGWSRRHRTAAVLALTAAIMAMAVRTWVRNPDWATSSSVLESVIRDHPESYRAQWTLGATAYRAGDYPKAALHYAAAYRIYPRDSEFLTEYGNFLMSRQRFDRALALLEQAYRQHPYIQRSTFLLAYAYLTVGKFEDALRMARRSEELGVSLAMTMRVRAYAYERTGDYGRAAAAWRVAARHETKPQDWHDWTFQARALARAGHDDAALEVAAGARPFAPDSAAAALVDSLQEAVRAGCYRNGQPVAAQPAGPLLIGRPPAASCDPLGDWLYDVTLQIADSSQYARPAALPGQYRGLRLVQ